MTDFYLPSWPQDEETIRSLASGRVPEDLQDLCRAMVDFELETGRLDYVGRKEQQQQQAPRKRKRA